MKYYIYQLYKFYILNYDTLKIYSLFWTLSSIKRKRHKNNKNFKFGCSIYYFVCEFRNAFCLKQNKFQINKTLEGHSSYVYSIATSSYGKYLQAVHGTKPLKSMI